MNSNTAHKVAVDLMKKALKILMSKKLALFSFGIQQQSCHQISKISMWWIKRQHYRTMYMNYYIEGMNMKMFGLPKP